MNAKRKANDNSTPENESIAWELILPREKEFPKFLHPWQ